MTFFSIDIFKIVMPHFSISNFVKISFENQIAQNLFFFQMMTFDHIFRKINVCAFEQTRTDSTSSELLKYMIEKLGYKVR